MHRLRDASRSSAAQAFQNADIDAVDISPAALEVAHRNVDDYGLDDRIALYEGDLFAPLPGVRYEVIITNPPYVNAMAMSNLPAEYRTSRNWRLRAARTAWTWCGGSSPRQASG